MIRSNPFLNRHLAHSSNSSRIGTILLVSALLLTGMLASAQNVSEVRFDASALFTEPSPPSYDLGSAESPTGAVIGLNSRYLTLNGSP
jgi:hypothetical protein